MELYDNHTLFQELCKTKGKWGLLISFGWWDGSWEEVHKAALILNDCLDHKSYPQAMFDAKAYFLFDTEEELNKAYYGVVGNDGPTKLNPYDGSLNIYALTCSNEGDLLTENT